MAISPGDKLGTYEILAPLGAGGMGEVYTRAELDWDALQISCLPINQDLSIPLE